MNNALSCIAILAAFSGTSVYADSIIIGSLTPNGGNSDPFGGTLPGFTGTRYQQAYASSDFDGLGPIEITSISFVNSDPSGGAPLAASTYTFSFSTITAGIDTLSNTNFNGNLGPNNTLFAIVPLSGTAPSILTITGSTPFLYDPSQGNLLLDIVVSPGGVPFLSSLVSGAAFDSPLAPGVFSRYQNFSENGTGVGAGLSTEFSFATPEPAAIGPTMLGIVLLVFLSHRRSSAKKCD
jgi:hypothetical protein